MGTSALPCTTTSRGQSIDLCDFTFFQHDETQQSRCHNDVELKQCVRVRHACHTRTRTCSSRQQFAERTCPNLEHSQPTLRRFIPQLVCGETEIRTSMYWPRTRASHALHTRSTIHMQRAEEVCAEHMHVQCHFRLRSTCCSLTSVTLACTSDTSSSISCNCGVILFSPVYSVDSNRSNCTWNSSSWC